MTAAISSADLAAVVRQIFASMAAMQLSPSGTLIAPDQGTGYLVSAVQIVGEWQAAVRLDIDLELARQACARLMSVDANELSLNDIRDATGELANIAGGTIRTLRAPNSALSLPSVALGHDFEFTLSQGKVVQAASFLTPSGVLTISIIEKEAPRQPLRVASPPQ